MIGCDDLGFIACCGNDEAGSIIGGCETRCEINKNDAVDIFFTMSQEMAQIENCW